MTYCGDHTLLVSRNAARVRKNSWGTRGRRGAARASTVIAAQARQKAANDTRLSVPTLEEPSTGQCRYCR